MKTRSPSSPRLREERLSKQELERYDRQLRVSGLGVEGQLKLKSAIVLVAGVGGLGGIASMYLAAAGVGKIRLVDDGRLELSNLNRQLPYSEKDVGRIKVALAAHRLSEINSEIDVEPVDARIDSDNIVELLRDVDLVVDGMDNFSTRFIINDECVRRNIPFVHGAIYSLEGRLMTIIPGEGPCLRCLLPHPPPEYGTIPVLGPVPGVIGSLEALEAIKILTGLGKPFIGKLLIFDGSDLSFQTIPIQRSPSCPVCSSPNPPTDK